MLIYYEIIGIRFTRLIDEIGLAPYSERLKALGITTLVERRVRGDLIEAYKIISGVVNYGSKLLNISRSGVNLVSSHRRLYHDIMRRNIFSERVIPYWNALPTYVKTSSSVNVFIWNVTKMLYPQ